MEPETSFLLHACFLLGQTLATLPTAYFQLLQLERHLISHRQRNGYRMVYTYFEGKLLI